MQQTYERDLRRRISEVLHYIWDPIGVRGEPRARDEYDSYVAGVYALLESGSGADQIAAHLDRIASQRMCLRSNMEHCHDTARKLLDWKIVLLEKRSEILG